MIVKKQAEHPEGQPIPVLVPPWELERRAGEKVQALAVDLNREHGDWTRETCIRGVLKLHPDLASIYLGTSVDAAILVRWGLLSAGEAVDVTGIVGPSGSEGRPGLVGNLYTYTLGGRTYNYSDPTEEVRQRIAELRLQHPQVPYATIYSRVLEVDPFLKKLYARQRGGELS